MNDSTAAAPTYQLTSRLGKSLAIQVFLAFALAYFFSALVRAVTATLAPTLSAEFGLGSGDLGLLAGGYFLGFALTQLPLGAWLDSYGPRRVIVCFLSVAVLGCLAFSWATSFSGLLAARVLCGVGVSACLMAPLTGYRRWFAPASQLRANSWMLMTGSLGMLASTLPVQWFVPQWGWRALFVLLAASIAAAAILLAWRLPAWERAPVPAQPTASGTDASKATTPHTSTRQPSLWQTYGRIFSHPYFVRHMPMGFFCYGGLLAMQTLWAGPWLVQVSGYTPAQAAAGLFWLNVCMLCTFFAWGSLNPLLARKGWHADWLIARGFPLGLLVLGLICWGGAQVQWWGWALFCMAYSFMSLAQPAIGMAFPPALAGRALSAYNLVIFSGVFAVQWGIGLLIDLFKAQGFATAQAFSAAMGVFGLCCALSYGFFISRQNSAIAGFEASGSGKGTA